MKQKEIFEPKMLSQCPVCRAVEMLMANGRPAYQQSIAVFPNLPKKGCYEHSL